MGKRLPNSHAFTVDRRTNEPVTGPLEIGHCRMLELSVAVWTENQQVSWVVADVRVKMVYFKVRFAVPFFESEKTKLTFPIMQFSKQNANCRRRALVALGHSRRYPWTWSAYRLLSNAQQLFLGHPSRALSGQARKRT
jgi:hypothetical protein